jgi:hypothetical protein
VCAACRVALVNVYVSDLAWQLLLTLDTRRSRYDANGPPVFRFVPWTTRNVGIGGSAAH